MYTFLKFPIVAAITVCFSGCTGTQSAVKCIDPAKIDPNGICTEQWDPVCGCDGVTYSNKCFADIAGVTSTKPGECPK